MSLRLPARTLKAHVGSVLGQAARTQKQTYVTCVVIVLLCSKAVRQVVGNNLKAARGHAGPFPVCRVTGCSIPRRYMEAGVSGE